MNNTIKPIKELNKYVFYVTLAVLDGFLKECGDCTVLDGVHGGIWHSCNGKTIEDEITKVEICTNDVGKIHDLIALLKSLGEEAVYYEHHVNVKGYVV